MNASPGPHDSCSCCHLHAPPGLTRRKFVVRLGATAAGVGLLGASRVLAAAAGGPPDRRALRVQPVLVYSTPVRREGTSWRSWGGIQTEADADAEVARIGKELAAVKAAAGVPLEIRPVTKVRTDAAAAEVAKEPCDVRILYAAGGGLKTLESLISLDRDTLMFLRHDPGPAYLWYEIVHPRLLRKTVDEYGQPGLDVHDIAVDDPGELAWRLRALSGLRNTIGTKMVAIGGAGGWGAGGRQAPAVAKEKWKFDIVDVPYAALAPRLQAAMDDPVRRRKAAAEAERLLGGWRVSMKTGRDFLDRAYVMTDVFRELMREAGAGAITVNACMGTIMGISKTTACMPLSFLNDEGWLAFCESDFVVIPSGVLLHNISGLPVFLNDPTTPHGGIVTLAHCTAPRKMDGRRLEPVK
ncbi:MAG: sugar isomerase, partial [Verrucomicrobia bacterium]|nr:sugar isomerase [Verrucomicrobiota bacterium]